MDERLPINVAKDVDGILKQLAGTFATEQAEINTLKNSLRIAEEERKRLQIECHKWMNKCEKITKLFRAHIGSLNELVRRYVDGNSMLTDASFAESLELVPHNIDDLLQDSKLFDPTEYLSPQQNDEIYQIDKVKEEMVEVKEEIVEVKIEIDEESGINNEQPSNEGNEEINEVNQLNDDEGDKEIDEVNQPNDKTNGPSEEERVVYLGESDADYISLINSDILSVGESSSDEKIVENIDANDTLKNSDSDVDGNLIISVNDHSTSDDSDRELLQERKKKIKLALVSADDDRFMSTIVINKPNLNQSEPNADEYGKETTTTTSELSMEERTGPESIQRYNMVGKRFPRISHFNQHSVTSTDKSLQCHTRGVDDRSKQNANLHFNNRVCKTLPQEQSRNAMCSKDIPKQKKALDAFAEPPTKTRVYEIDDSPPKNKNKKSVDRALKMTSSDRNGYVQTMESMYAAHPNRTVTRPNRTTTRPNRTVTRPNRTVTHPNRSVKSSGGSFFVTDDNEF